MLSSLSPPGRISPSPSPPVLVSPEPIEPRLFPQAVLRLGQEDWPDCVSLDRQSLGGLWTQEQWLVELTESNRMVVGWRHHGALVALASAWLVLDELHITAVAVHPDYRRLGLGRAVVQGLLGLAQRAGAQRATLEVSSANQAAKALYAGLGFQEVAVRRAYYRNGDDALIQYLKL